MKFREKIKGGLSSAKKNYSAYIFIAPAIIGILAFTLYPMITSLYYSFFDYDILNPPRNFGFQNYIAPFTEAWAKGNFLQSIKITTIFTVISIPLSLVLSFSLALFLNRELKGIKVFRLIYYSPIIIPSISLGLVWRNVTDYYYGIGNAMLGAIGLEPFAFLTSSSTAMLTIFILGLFTTGAGMVLWLAQLKAIPQDFYEVANIEGCGFWRKLFTITIPMCSPVIFYNIITGIIGSLQTFQSVYIMTGGTGGPENSLFFYVMNIYAEAMNKSNIGYASALSWMLFIVIGALTLVIFKTSKWVFYGEES